MGNDTGALAGTFGEYDQDDKEADEVHIYNRNNICLQIVLSWHFLCLTPRKHSAGTGILQVWEAIDTYMDQRRKDQREKRLKEEIEKYRKENPKITEQFAPYKRKLADLSQSEWESIPEIGDYTRHKSNKMQASGHCRHVQHEKGVTQCLSLPLFLIMYVCVQIYTPTPDNLLTQRLNENEKTTTLDTRGGLDGLATPGGMRCSTSIKIFL